MAQRRRRPSQRLAAQSVELAWAAPQVVMNAVADALAQVGAVAPDMPATPEKLWRAISGAG